jgi:hypothetical protein
MSICICFRCLRCGLIFLQQQGQTGAHYAMAYNFFDLGAWLLDPDKGGGSDEIENHFGLGPYDGLSPEG